MLHDIFARSDANGRGAIGSGSASFQTQRGHCDDLPVDHSDDDTERQSRDERPTTNNIGQSSRGVQKRQKKKTHASINVDAVEALQTIAESMKLVSTSKSSKSNNSPDIVLACMEALNGMDLPDEIYCPACTMFSGDPIRASLFYNMPPHRRHKWLYDVIPTILQARAQSAGFPPTMGSTSFNVVPPADPFGRQSSNNMFDMPPPPPGPFF